MARSAAVGGVGRTAGDLFAGPVKNMFKTYMQ